MKSKLNSESSMIFRLLFLLIALILIGGISKRQAFFNLGNFQTMEQNLSEYGLMSLGVAICMIAGGIDLSCVYIANMCGIIAAYCMIGKLPIPIAIIIAILIGAACGVLNGFLVAVLNVPAMLATLGTYQLFFGISIVLSNGSTVNGLPDVYSQSGTRLIFGVIPFSFVIFIVTVVILAFIMNRTVLGRRIYLIGTNKQCAKFAGINTQKNMIIAYMISGIVSGIAGLLCLARLNSIKADFGTSYTMQTILICVLGGINPDGGKGSLYGAAVAVLILQVLSSYLNTFSNVSNYYRSLIWGLALIVILIVNLNIEKRRNLKLNKT